MLTDDTRRCVCGNLQQRIIKIQDMDKHLVLSLCMQLLQFIMS